MICRGDRGESWDWREKGFKLILMAFLALWFFSFIGCGGSGLHIRTDAPAALILSDKNPKVISLIARNFRKPFLKKVACSLQWIKGTGKYVWQVEYLDSSCGCGGSPPGVVVCIDPNEGKVISVKLFKRRTAEGTCNKNCHSAKLKSP